jgi:hypothetical protein
MGRVLTFQRSATGQSSWTVDRDSLLNGYHSTGSFVLSRDINDTVTNFFTPTATRIADNTIIVGTNSVTWGGLPDVPVFQGEVIYFNCSAAITAQIHMVDPVS